MTIRDKLRENKILDKVMEKDFVVVIAVGKKDKFDTQVALDDINGEMTYLRRVSFNDEVDEDTHIYVVSSDAWHRMTTKNIWMNRDAKD